MSKGNGTIGVVGSNMIDLVTYTDRMPRPGETIEAPDFLLGFGGKGANQAIAAARLGSAVTVVTRCLPVTSVIGNTCVRRGDESCLRFPPFARRRRSCPARLGAWRWRRRSTGYPPIRCASPGLA